METGHWREWQTCCQLIYNLVPLIETLVSIDHIEIAALQTAKLCYFKIITTQKGKLGFLIIH